MESKRTDVRFLVLLRLLQTLFEFAVLLETVLLCHLALLFLRLHDTAFRTEILQFTVKHLVFAELTFQRTVIERIFDAGLQTDLVEALLTIGEHPGVIALELVLQAFTDHLVGAKKVGCRDTLTIRRIGDDDALLRRLCKILEVLLLDGDIAGETGSLHIEQRRIHSLDIHIIAVDVMLELPFLTLVVVDVVEEFGIEVRPFLKRIFVTEQAGSHVLGNQGGLDQQGTGSAHRVDEVRVSLPT